MSNLDVHEGIYCKHIYFSRCTNFRYFHGGLQIVFSQYSHPGNDNLSLIPMINCLHSQCKYG